MSYFWDIVSQPPCMILKLCGVLWSWELRCHWKCPFTLQAYALCIVHVYTINNCTFFLYHLWKYPLWVERFVAKLYFINSTFIITNMKNKFLVIKRDQCRRRKKNKLKNFQYHTLLIEQYLHCQMLLSNFLPNHISKFEMLKIALFSLLMPRRHSKKLYYSLLYMCSTLPQIRTGSDDGW